MHRLCPCLCFKGYILHFSTHKVTFLVVCFLHFPKCSWKSSTDHMSSYIHLVKHVFEEREEFCGDCVSPWASVYECRTMCLKYLDVKLHTGYRMSPKMQVGLPVAAFLGCVLHKDLAFTLTCLFLCLCSGDTRGWRHDVFMLSVHLSHSCEHYTSRKQTWTSFKLWTNLRSDSTIKRVRFWRLCVISENHLVLCSFITFMPHIFRKPWGFFLKLYTNAKPD